MSYLRASITLHVDIFLAISGKELELIRESRSNCCFMFIIVRHPFSSGRIVLNPNTSVIDTSSVQKKQLAHHQKVGDDLQISYQERIYDETGWIEQGKNRTGKSSFYYSF